MDSILVTFVSIILPIIIARTIDTISSSYSKKLSRRTKPDYYIGVLLINIIIYAIFFSSLSNFLEWIISKSSVNSSTILSIGIVSLIISFIMSYAIVMKLTEIKFTSVSMKYKIRSFLNHKYFSVGTLQLISAVTLLHFILKYLTTNVYTFSDSMGVNVAIVLFVYSFYASYTNFHFALSPMTEVEQMKVIFMNNEEIHCIEVKDEKDMVCITRLGMNGNEQIVNDLYVNKTSIQSIIYEKRFVFPVYNYFVDRLRKSNGLN